MNISGILVGIALFIIIGIFHPIVIKFEYYLGKKNWPVFLILGLIACGFSLFIQDTIISSILAVLGFTCFWTIKELYEQEERVLKGWFPMNPKRVEYYESTQLSYLEKQHKKSDTQN